ncbi:stress-induced protein KIN2-like [Rhododendron vialii]|uniref:stress-induced protein KIN2-like n=1 Tax=Rhododendron vialii TaxID=182163 RepID=UPI00265F129D|nr:stress-induced protein KIN2-like [Rhododendron vialii]
MVRGQIIFHMSTIGLLSKSINLGDSKIIYNKKLELDPYLENYISLLKEAQAMDNSQNASYQAGQAKGQAQEKGNQMMDKANNAAQSCKETMQETGEQAKAKAQGAADAVKNATGMNK